MSSKTGIDVMVMNNNVDQALKVLKRKIAQEGVLKQLKYKKAYEKPSERRRRKLRESQRRVRKLIAKRSRRAMAD